MKQFLLKLAHKILNKYGEVPVPTEAPIITAQIIDIDSFDVNARKRFLHAMKIITEDDSFQNYKESFLAQNKIKAFDNIGEHDDFKLAKATLEGVEMFTDGMAEYAREYDRTHETPQEFDKFSVVG